MNEPRTSYPTAAAKDFMIPKPGLGILLIRTCDKAGVRLEVASRPFPYIADHLTTSERAVTGGQRVNWDASQRAPIKICTFQRRRIITPGISSPVFCQALTVRRWFRTRRSLPLRLRWQTPIRPATVSISLMPVDMDDWQALIEGDRFIEVTPQPATVFLSLPIDRMFCPFGCPPLPTFRSPEFAPSVAAIFNEMLEFTVANGRLRDCKRRNLYVECRLFVIENETSFWSASESECAVGYLCVARQVIVGLSKRLLFRKAHLVIWRDCWRGIAQSLTRVSDRFIVHLLV